MTSEFDRDLKTVRKFLEQPHYDQTGAKKALDALNRIDKHTKQVKADLKRFWNPEID